MEEEETESVTVPIQWLLAEKCYILNSILIYYFFRYYISQCNALNWNIPSVKNEPKAMHFVFFLTLVFVQLN